MIINSRLGLVRSRSNVDEKYEGSQNRKNQNIGSMKNLPKTKAQVWGNVNNRTHLICFLSSPWMDFLSWPSVIRASSSFDKCLFLRGISYNHSHANNQTKPSAPVMMNTYCQPKETCIQGVINSASTTPTLVPELNIPAASARSFFGNHSDTAFIPAGKFPASPSPKPIRSSVNPVTVRAAA